MFETNVSSDSFVNLTYVGHATVLIEMAGVKILTDPVFRSRLWFLRRHRAPSPSRDDLAGLDAVLLSHMHFDHMDYPSLRAIPGDVPIIAPRGARRYLRRKVPQQVVELGEGDRVQVGAITVHGTPSLHNTGFYWPFWFPNSVLSYLIEGPRNVFFVGDTALFDNLALLGEYYRIDAALLPVWGFGPYIRGDHLSPSDAATALSMLSPRVAIPIHWGTLRPMGPMWRGMSFLADPPNEFAWVASVLAPETDVRVLLPGESTLVY